MIGMLFHIDRVLIGIEVGIDLSTLTSGMTKNKLCNDRSGHFIEMGCGRMAKEMGVKVLIDL